MPIPYLADLEAEEQGWYEVVRLVRALDPDQRLAPGYYTEPDWSVRDVVGHLGTWLAEAAVQFERLLAGTYGGHDVDIDGLNARFLAALHDQPWDVVWTQANAARTRLRQAWEALPEPNDEAAWWIRKGAAHHYGEHLPRLREWVDELVGRRAGHAGASKT
jgi:FAD/FMN-containing dehydrogenase